MKLARTKPMTGRMKMGRKTALFLCGILTGFTIWFFARNNHELFYVHEKPRWHIEVRHDNQNCFAFIMDRETQVHHYILDCKDTTILTKNPEAK